MEKKECPTCDGTGVILGDREYGHDGMPIQDYEDCPRCNGTGKIEDEE